MQVLADADDELAGVVPAGGGGWKRRSVLFVDGDPFLNGPTEFGIDLGLVAAVDAATDEAAARAYDADMYANEATPLAARLAAGCVAEAALCVPIVRRAAACRGVC